MEWMDKLKDMLKTHIYNGLTETYRSVNQMTGGNRVLMAFQVALDGIKDLSKNKLNTDYQVLLATLHRNNFDENALEQRIKFAFYEYAKRALQSAGLNCEQLNFDLINVANGPEFVHHVYINTAREVWMQPGLFSHEFTAPVQLENQRSILKIIDGAIERSVRDGVDLNKIITVYQTGTVPPVKRRVRELTLKEKFNNLNHHKTLLDEMTDGDDAEDYVVQAAHSIAKTGTGTVDCGGLGGVPPTPSTMGASTIDNDELAPDSLTIDSPSRGPSPVPVPEGPMKIKLNLDTESSASTNSTVRQARPRIRPSPEQDTVSIHTVVNGPGPSHLSRRKIRKRQQDGGGTGNGRAGTPDSVREVMCIKLDPNTKYSKPEGNSTVKIVRTKSTTPTDDISVYSPADTSSESGSGSSNDNDSITTLNMDTSESNEVVVKLMNADTNSLPSGVAEDVQVTMITPGTPAVPAAPVPTTTAPAPASAPAPDIPDVDVMFKNAGKSKTKPRPEADQSQNDNRKFTLTGTGSERSMGAKAKVRLVDDSDALSSRLSRLRARKTAIRALGMEN